MKIENEAEYDEILEIINELLDADPKLGSIEGKCLDILTAAVVEYEKNIIQLK